MSARRIFSCWRGVIERRACVSGRAMLALVLFSGLVDPLWADTPILPTDRLSVAQFQARLASSARGANPTAIADRDFLFAVRHKSPKTIMRMLDAGANLRATDPDGRTVLIMAAARGHAKLVEVLLAEPAVRHQLNATDRHRWTPLMVAAAHGHQRAVEVFLAQPHIDVNMTDEYGWSALMIAALQGELAVVKRLVAHSNIDLNLRNLSGRTALMEAVDKDLLNIVQALVGHAKIDLNVRQINFGTTALMLAADRGNR